MHIYDEIALKKIFVCILHILFFLKWPTTVFLLFVVKSPKFKLLENSWKTWVIFETEFVEETFNALYKWSSRC